MAAEVTEIGSLLGQSLLVTAIRNRINSKRALNTILKKGRLDKMISLWVQIIVMTLVCISLVVSWQELGQPIFLEGTFGLNPIHCCKV
jgi:hypothetical protein